MTTHIVGLWEHNQSWMKHSPLCHLTNKQITFRSVSHHAWINPSSSYGTSSSWVYRPSTLNKVKLKENYPCLLLTGLPFLGSVASILTKNEMFSWGLWRHLQSAQLEAILKTSMKHGMFGIKFDGMKHRIRRDVANLESIRIGSKVKVLEAQGHFQDDRHFTLFENKGFNWENKLYVRLISYDMWC